MRLSYFSATPSNAPGPNRLVLGKVHYAEVGTPIRYYWTGIALANSYAGISFSHTGPGTSYADRWEWTPGAAGVFKIALKDDDGGVVYQTILVGSGGATNPVLMSVTGDSITHGGGILPWHGTIKSRLTAAGVTATMMGTQSFSGDATVKHEGFPGRTYQWHVDGTPPSTDVPPYRSGGVFNMAPYVVTWGQAKGAVLALGTNDCGNNRLDSNLDPDTQEDLDYARTLFNGFRTHMPTTKMAICLPYNPNGIASSWGPTAPANETLLYEYRQRRHRFLEMLLAEFSAEILTGEVHILNIHASVADVNFAGNNIHPAAAGHLEVADMVYPWFRHLARTG